VQTPDRHVEFCKQLYLMAKLPLSDSKFGEHNFIILNNSQAITSERFISMPVLTLNLDLDQ